MTLLILIYSGCSEEITDPESQDVFEFNIVNGNVGSVYTVALSAGDKYFAWGGLNPAVKVSGKPPFNSHISSINAIDFSYDGKLLLSGSSDNNIKLWDVESATLLSTFSEHITNTWDVIFTPDGKSAISSEDNYVVYWRNAVDGPIGRLALYGHTDMVSSVDMSNDMKTIISGSRDKSIKIWDAQTGDLRKTINDHNVRVYDIEFNPDNSQFAACIGDSTISFWDSQTFNLIKALKNSNGNSRSISYHSSGKYIASAGPGSVIYIWDIANEQVFRTLEGHTELVRMVKFSPTGNNIISGGTDDKVIIWKNVFSNPGLN